MTLIKPFVQFVCFFLFNICVVKLISGWTVQDVFANILDLDKYPYS